MSSSPFSSSSPSESSASPERQMLAENANIQPNKSNGDPVAILDPSEDVPVPPANPTSTAENEATTALIDVSSSNISLENGILESNQGRSPTPAPAPNARGSPQKGRANGDRLLSSVIDGRVKNPVPSKLQNKTNKKDGNFAVMHMGSMKKRPQLDERDLAAKRASEATQAAALAAQRDGYSSYKRHKHIWNPDDLGIIHRGPTAPSLQPPSQPPSQNSYLPQANYSQHQQPSPQHQQLHQPLGLPPSSVKAEQARLLTFIRGINPMLVVDQLCKGLAYFGGVPEAPPPQDQNGFPQSAQNNGSGGLFVGWLSEIFPHAEVVNSSMPTRPGVAEAHPEQANNTVPPAPTAPPAPPATGKRGRGRPKGSKSTKVRKDKGIKKGPKVNLEGQGNIDAQESQINGAPHGHAPGTGISQPEGQHSTTSQVSATQSSPAEAPSSNGPQDADLSILQTPGSKKRGRPKGSKNRPRPQLVDLTQQSGSGSNTAPGPIDSPTQNVARAAINASNAQPRASFPSPPAAPTSEDSQAPPNKRRRFSKGAGQSNAQWAQHQSPSSVVNASQSFGSQSSDTAPQAGMSQTQQPQRPSPQQQFRQPQQQQAQPSNGMGQGQKQQTTPNQRRPGSFSQQPRPSYMGQQGAQAQQQQYMQQQYNQARAPQQGQAQGQNAGMTNNANGNTATRE